MGRRAGQPRNESLGGLTVAFCCPLPLEASGLLGADWPSRFVFRMHPEAVVVASFCLP